MHPPRHLTFTGVDDAASASDYLRMMGLSARYPIEWAILYSRERGGTPRYPGWAVFQAMVAVAVDTTSKIAVHLCGAAAREFMDGRVEQGLGYMLHDVSRVQINVAGKEVVEKGVEAAIALAARLDVELILQCRDQFPLDERVSWLFDQSGGRGKLPQGAWPIGGNAICGYAGGLGPDNIAEHARAIALFGGPYWLDMETGIRTDDRFDLDKVESVCKAIYG